MLMLRVGARRVVLRGVFVGSQMRSSMIPSSIPSTTQPVAPQPDHTSSATRVILIRESPRPIVLHRHPPANSTPEAPHPAPITPPTSVWLEHFGPKILGSVKNRPSAVAWPSYDELIGAWKAWNPQRLLLAQNRSSPQSGIPSSSYDHPGPRTRRKVALRSAACLSTLVVK
ncbi:uncharacterized protein BJX67DRAFT_52355 [Aspergillus lucknowensis]|uniref:Uncharacterized protein n=1 Tax=Aspergillus lucknowensis TaxID=176173 RepID=A0ABR4LUR0_9EURO